MRKIIFYGNCYASTLEAVYSAAIAPLRGDASSYVSCYEEDADGSAARRIADADIIVQQVFDVDQKMSLDSVGTAAEIVRFPTVSLGFLWPYGLVPHAKNSALDYWQCGPYDYLLGDNFLNRKIERGASPDDAVAEYLALDIAKHAHLDRLREIMIDRQRARDARCDMAFADEMDARFQSEDLFLNPYRPNARMAARLAAAVYGRLGVGADEVERLTARWRKTPFERTALPIHPGVARHFGLSYGHEGEKYLYHSGEMLTFEQYIRRHAAFTWNEQLLKGVATLHWAGNDVFRQFRGDVPEDRVDEALTDLREGLAASEGSALGERAVAALLLRRGQADEALAALRRATAFDSADAEAQHDLGSLLESTGDYGEAEAAFRAAIEQDPTFDPAYAALARLLERSARLDDAVAALETASALRPGQGYYAYDLARLHALAGRRAEAKAGFRRAMELLTGNSHPALRLAELHIADDEADEARAMIQRAADAGAEPDDIAAMRARLEQPARHGFFAFGRG